MPLRSVKMNRFIFGFQRRVWCPKWTPLSSSWRIVTTAMVVPLVFGCRDGPGGRRPDADDPPDPAQLFERGPSGAPHLTGVPGGLTACEVGSPERAAVHSVRRVPRRGRAAPTGAPRRSPWVDAPLRRPSHARRAPP